MDYPTFSIVMPTFQRREVVCDALRSLTALKYGGDVEIIVVIDGSTDGSAEALAQIAGPFPVHIIEQDNQGASSARNRGASEARGDIILFLDDDMICESDLVEQHARMYRDGADAVIGRTPIDPQSPRGFLPDSVARWIDSACVQTPLSPFDIFTGQLSVRRLVFEELGGFDTALTSGGAFGSEDADFGVRLLAAHDVRYSGSAVSFQRYVVKPREYRDRVDRAVAAHLQFVRRHPHLARDLFDRRGIGGRMVRWVYRPLSGVPFLSIVISRLVVTIAEAGLRTRFRSNRALARFFSAACSLAYWTALRQRGWFPSSNSVLILCYHAIGDEDDPLLARFSVPSKRFELQLESLTSRGFTFITPAQLAAFLDSHAPLPRRPVLLTFDDGYTELLDLAREVLRPRGIEGIAFIVTAAAANEWDQAYGARAIDLMTREQLKELAELGIEIASHSRTHGEMQLMSEAEQEAEAAGSFRDLTHDGLPPPRFFAYPYGASNAESKEAVKSVGFLAAFGLKQSRLQRTSDRFDLPRVIVLAEDGGWRFHAKTAAPRLFNLFIRAQRKLGSIFK